MTGLFSDRSTAVDWHRFFRQSDSPIENEPRTELARVTRGSRVKMSAVENVDGRFPREAARRDAKKSFAARMRFRVAAHFSSARAPPRAKEKRVWRARVSGFRRPRARQKTSERAAGVRLNWNDVKGPSSSQRPRSFDRERWRTSGSTCHCLNLLPP